MMRLSPTGLLIVGAFSVPLFTQLRTALGLFGIDIAWETVIAVAAVWFGVLVLLTILPESNGDTDPSGQ